MKRVDHAAARPGPGLGRRSGSRRPWPEPVTSTTASPAPTIPMPRRHTARRRSRSSDHGAGEAATTVTTTATQSTHRTARRPARGPPVAAPARHRSGASCAGSGQLGRPRSWSTVAGAGEHPERLAHLQRGPIGMAADDECDGPARRRRGRWPGTPACPTTSVDEGNRSAAVRDEDDGRVLVELVGDLVGQGVADRGDSSTSTARSANSRCRTAVRSIHDATMATNSETPAEHRRATHAHRRARGRVAAGASVTVMPPHAGRATAPVGTASYFGCIRMAPSSRIVSPFR